MNLVLLKRLQRQKLKIKSNGTPKENHNMKDNKKELKDNSPTWFHEEMLESNEGRRASKIAAFKGYLKLGIPKEKAIWMAGLKVKGKE